MEQLRQSVLMDSQVAERKTRFGLFSQPSPVGLTDDSGYEKKQAKRGEDGKPITKPRNLLGGMNRSGVGRKSFVTASSSIHVGDEYMDPEKADQLLGKKFLKREHSIHENDFKPSNAQSPLLRSYSFKHHDEDPIPKPKPPRDPDTGRVATKLKNVTSNSMAKIEKELFRSRAYLPDPYERKEEMEHERQRVSKQKRMSDDKIFRSNSSACLPFLSDKATYGQDHKAKDNEQKFRSPFVESAQAIVKHEGSFKPAAGRSHGNALGKYPEYLDEALPSQFTRKHEGQEEQREKWRHVGNRSLSRPTPSISCSLSNLRRYK